MSEQYVNAETVQAPEVGTTVHLCLMTPADTFVCQPAIVVKVEDGEAELGPEELRGERVHMLHLAIITRQGTGGVFSGIGYAPLSAGDASGTWHYRAEHRHTHTSVRVCGDVPCGEWPVG